MVKKTIADDLIIELNAQVDRLTAERNQAREERDYYMSLANPPAPKLLSTPGDYFTVLVVAALSFYGAYSGFMAIFY